MSDERQGWPEIVDPPTEVEEGQRLLIRWLNGREELVTVTNIHETDVGYRLEVTSDPPPDLPEFYNRFPG